MEKCPFKASHFLVKMAGCCRLFLFPAMLLHAKGQTNPVFERGMYKGVH
jgi:hypothetical protein